MRTCRITDFPFLINNKEVYLDKSTSVNCIRLKTFSRFFGSEKGPKFSNLGANLVEFRV